MWTLMRGKHTLEIISIQECHNLLVNIRKLQSEKFNINNEVK